MDSRLNKPVISTNSIDDFPSINTKDKRMIILYAVPIPLCPCWSKKTGIFILGTLIIMTVDKY